MISQMIQFRMCLFYIALSTYFYPMLSVCRDKQDVQDKLYDWMATCLVYNYLFTS